MVQVRVHPAGRAVKQKTDAVKTASVFLYAGKASPKGGSCQRPRPLTDEGQVCHGNPETGNRGELAPHPALRGHLPPQGKAFLVNL